MLPRHRVTPASHGSQPASGPFPGGWLPEHALSPEAPEQNGCGCRSQGFPDPGRCPAEKQPRGPLPIRWSPDPYCSYRRHYGSTAPHDLCHQSALRILTNPATSRAEARSAPAAQIGPVRAPCPLGPSSQPHGTRSGVLGLPLGAAAKGLPQRSRWPPGASRHIALGPQNQRAATSLLKWQPGSEG